MHLSPADSETRIDLHMTNSTTGHGATDGVQFGYQNSAGAYVWNFENADTYFGTNNTERARILAAGGLTFNGDTAAANALNDYERGNWTPTVVQGGWNIHTNYYSKYVKIGNFVHVQFYIGVNGSGTGSSLILGGLPFNSDSNGYSAGTIDFGQGGVKGQYMRIESSSDDLYFFYPSENNSSSRIGLAANQIGASYIIGTIGYYTSQ